MKWIFKNIPVKALFNKSQLSPGPSYYLVGFLGGSLWTCQQRVGSLLKSETASYLLLNNIIWLRGQDLLKTLQLVPGYEVVAGGDSNLRPSGYERDILLMYY